MVRGPRFAAEAGRVTRVRCRWHIVVTATDLDADPYGALRPGTAFMPDDADVVLEVVGPLRFADGAAVGRTLHGARTVEVLARGPGVPHFVAALTASTAELVA